MTAPPDKQFAVGNVSYPVPTSTSFSSQIWPQIRDRSYKCPCGEKLQRKRLVTKAKKMGRFYEVEGEAMALHCAKCGPVAWEA